MAMQIVPTPRKVSTAIPSAPSLAAGRDVVAFDQAIAGLPSSQSTADFESKIGHRLFDVLVNAKVQTSKFAMHLDRDWRARLFAQLDDLLAEDGWHEEDIPLEISSYSTFLRMIIYFRPSRRPALGLSNRGYIVAAWASGNDRLVMECLPSDLVRWNLSIEEDGERERVAGETQVVRLPERLRSYAPERWFEIEETAD